MFGWWTTQGRAALQAEGEYQAKLIVLLALIESVIRCQDYHTEVLASKAIKICTPTETYLRTVDWLMGCDYSNVPVEIGNLLLRIVRSQGFCNE